METPQTTDDAPVAAELPSVGAPPLVRAAPRLYRYRFLLLALYAAGLLACWFGWAGSDWLMDDVLPWEVVAAWTLILTVLQALFLVGLPHWRWPRPTRRRRMAVSLGVAAGMGVLLTAGLLGTALSFFRLESAFSAAVSNVSSALGGERFNLFGIPWTIVALLGASWAGWLAVFTLGFAGEWSGRFRKIYRTLVAGTWLELLVTIPVDVQVRKRTSCYCEHGTFFALVIGITAAFWTFGPGLVMLFLTRRLQRVADLNTCTTCGYDLRGLTSSRCPECGTPFRRRPAATAARADACERHT